MERGLRFGICWFAVVFVLVSLVGAFPCLAGEGLSRAEIKAELAALKSRLLHLEKALAQLNVQGGDSDQVTPAKADEPQAGCGYTQKNGSGSEPCRPFVQSSTGLRLNPEKPEPLCSSSQSSANSADSSILRQGEKGVVGHLQAMQELGRGLQIGGTVEIEGAYEHRRLPGEKNQSSSAFELATVELVFDAFISPEIRAHLILDYEEGEGIGLDEALIHYRAEDVCRPDCSCNSPWFASLGKMTLPFGYYESHFISDPTTLQLGETQEIAALIGARSGPVTLAGAVFNGDLDEVGKDDHLDKFVAVLLFELPENLLDGISLNVGGSWIPTWPTVMSWVIFWPMNSKSRSS